MFFLFIRQRRKGNHAVHRIIWEFNRFVVAVGRRSVWQNFTGGSGDGIINFVSSAPFSEGNNPLSYPDIFSKMAKVNRHIMYLVRDYSRIICPDLDNNRAINTHFRRRIR
ncbi:MAG: hypothetical protein IJV07_01520 [Alphaproteobacteria bacterium]|nr:hypothetical protein [Alphaproteobacteria bacterium]